MTTHSSRHLERRDVERGVVTIVPTMRTNEATVLMVLHFGAWTHTRSNEVSRMCAMSSRTGLLRVSALRRPLITIREAARYTGLTERFVRRLRQEHIIRFYKVGGRIQFDPNDLDEYLASCAVTPSPHNRGELGRR
jgi:excisionase family DNA binding protein